MEYLQRKQENLILCVFIKFDIKNTNIFIEKGVLCLFFIDCFNRRNDFVEAKSKGEVPH